ncbi:hypothetical protein ACFX2A_013912 [Malus domestica]
MKKYIPFVWDKACNNAFESIKKYLSSPPVLGAPVPGKPLIFRTLTNAELNYSPIEKMCLALMFAIQKLRHYMHAYTIHLVVKTNPIIYIPAKAVKGQALADFLADHPIPAD